MGCGRTGEFETLLCENYRICISLERDFGETGSGFQQFDLFLLFSQYSLQKRRNAALSCGISAMHLFYQHILSCVDEKDAGAK